MTCLNLLQYRQSQYRFLPVFSMNGPVNILALTHIPYKCRYLLYNKNKFQHFLAAGLKGLPHESTAFAGLTHEKNDSETAPAKFLMKKKL